MPETTRFGSFLLFEKERRLTSAGTDVAIGGRALDILLLLVKNAGQIVSKQELLASIWPDVVVEEGTLRVHIASLRRALGENKAGVRYISNVAGRGYCFVARVERGEDTPQPPAPGFRTGLPYRSTRTIGREKEIEAVSKLLTEHRFVTIVGPGGVGKTTIATSVGRTELPSYQGAVCYFDIGPLPGNSSILPAVLAQTLGIVTRTEDVTTEILEYLRDKRMLIIFDCCEHVISGAAALAERIFDEAPQIYILATSREALRAHGERVYPLRSLVCPADTLSTTDEIVSSPAVQLFLDRSGFSTDPNRLSLNDARLIGAICRQLDGMALAIELAAGRVELHGLAGVAETLDQHRRLLWQGRRTATARHQTLRATLDWSYELLSETERCVLQRLSVFVGCFTLEAVENIVKCEMIDGNDALKAFDGLVDKCLVYLSDPIRSRYRLLDTTRTYAFEKLASRPDHSFTARRHAEFFRDFLESRSLDAAPSVWEDRGNVLSALEWSFNGGHTDLAISLAAAASDFFWELALLNECHCWTEQALASLDDSTQNATREMRLTGALGLSLMFARGDIDRAQLLYDRSFQLALSLEDRSNQIRALGRIHILQERSGEIKHALTAAQTCDEIASMIGDPAGIAASQAMMGIAQHYLGDQAAARSQLASALAQSAASSTLPRMYFGLDIHIRTKSVLAKTLWLQGLTDQAIQLAEETLEEATALRHPVSLCIALIDAICIFTWAEDFDRAQKLVDDFVCLATKHALIPYHAVGIGLKGVVNARCQNAEDGMAMLWQALQALQEKRYEAVTTIFRSALVDALANSGRPDEALVVVDEALAEAQSKGDLSCVADLLRQQAELLYAAGSERAVGVIEESIHLAQIQSAHAWEIRAKNTRTRFNASRYTFGSSARFDCQSVNASPVTN